MNEQSVKELASLLKSEPGVIEKALTEGGLDSVIEKYQKSVEIFTPDELAKKLKNHADDTIANLGKDGEQLPSHIYNMAKGNAFEAVEKKLAKENGIVDFDGLDDLVGKIAQKKVDESGKATGEKDTQIEDLKKLVKETEAEKEEVKTTLRKEFDDELIGIAIRDAVGLVPIDADNDELLQNQKTIVETMVKSNFKFERREGKIVTFDKDGNLIKDKVGDPVPVMNVVNDYSQKWVKVKSDPEGGRGGRSTEQGNKGIDSIVTQADLDAYMEKNNINPVGSEAFDLRMTIRQANPDVKI